MDSIGLNPVKNALRFHLVITLICTVIMLITWALDDSRGAGLVVMGFFVFIVMAITGLSMLVSLIEAIGTKSFYNKAKILVENGGLTPSYVGRNSLCQGICVVDEENKALFLNNEIFSWTDVREVKLNDDKVSVILKNGADPVRPFRLANANQAAEFFHRLLNTLGFSS